MKDIENQNNKDTLIDKESNPYDNTPAKSINKEKKSKENTNNDDIEEDQNENKIQELNIDDNGNGEKPACQRYFSPLGEGSLRSSIFSLSILSVGVGCLAIPQRFGQLSIVLATIIIIVACASTYWTLDVIIIAGRKKQLTVYSAVIKEFCGPRWAVFLDVTLIIYTLGIMIAYQIISKYSHKLL